MSSQVVEESLNTTTQRTMDGTPNALSLRLECQAIIENVELFLRGQKIVVLQTDTGDLIEKRVGGGTPKANSSGVQGIINYINLVLNPQTVQGNFPLEGKAFSPSYERFIEEFDNNLTSMIVINRISWGIKEEEAGYICSSIMNVVIPFMTRLIDNKERESYGGTIIHSDSKTAEKPQGMNLFGIKPR